MKSFLFSTDMVQAILKGIKTQTRRAVKPQPQKHHWEYFKSYKLTPQFENEKTIKAKYQIDDIVYVKETWCFGEEPGEIWYKTRDCDLECFQEAGDRKWKSPLFMPEKAARIFLKIKNIRLERIQDISDEDIFEEGIQIFLKETEDGEDSYYDVPAYWKNPEGKIIKRLYVDNHREAFTNLWDSINYKKGLVWEANPFVWVYDFERIER